jgi:hypothetical protein
MQSNLPCYFVGSEIVKFSSSQMALEKDLIRRMLDGGFSRPEVTKMGFLKFFASLTKSAHAGSLTGRSQIANDPYLPMSE